MHAKSIRCAYFYATGNAATLPNLVNRPIRMYAGGVFAWRWSLFALASNQVNPLASDQVRTTRHPETYKKASVSRWSNIIVPIDISLPHLLNRPNTFTTKTQCLQPRNTSPPLPPNIPAPSSTRTPTNPKPAIAQVIYTPDYTTPKYPVSIFLAGSICQDKAPQWQLSAIAHLAHLPITIYNPRVSNWDPNLLQDAAEKRFEDQVLWELKYLQSCSVIMMYLAPDEEGQAMDAPNSLLEFGRFADDMRLVVGCPERFNRRGNVVITGRVYGTQIVDDFPIPIRETIRKLEAAIAKENAKTAKHGRR